MDTLLAVLVGICIGGFGAFIPLGILYRGRGLFTSTSTGLMAEGLLAIVVSFALMSLGIYVSVMYDTLRVVTPVSVVLTFLFVWIITALRLQKSRGRMQRRRKGN